MKTKLLLLFTLISTLCFGQLQPIDHTAPNADNLKQAAIKINANDLYLNSRIDTAQANLDLVGTVITDEFPTNLRSIVSNVDVAAPGTVTLTNGSASVTGTGTQFTDASTSGVGFWFGFHVTDSSGTNYYIFLSDIASNTSATIQRVYSDLLFATPNSNPPSTWPGITGTYKYKVIRNKAEGPFAHAFGNNTYAKEYSIAMGGLATASGQASYALGNQVLSSGNRSFAGGWGSFSSGTGGDKRVLASGQAAFNWSTNFTGQVAGHGALAQASAILGGADHNIPADALYSGIFGGRNIKVGAGVQYTVHFPKVRFGLGTGAAVVTDNSNNNVLVRDATTGEVKIRNASTLGTVDTTHFWRTKSDFILNSGTRWIGYPTNSRIRFYDTSWGQDFYTEFGTAGEMVAYGSGDRTIYGYNGINKLSGTSGFIIYNGGSGSAGDIRFSPDGTSTMVLDNGNVILSQVPGSNDEEDAILVRNSSTGYVEVRSASTLGSSPLFGSATLDFGTVGLGLPVDLTITVNGAAVGDPVSLGVDPSVMTNSVFYTAFVSAANTVTVRAFNASGPNSDPPSATFKVTVHKQ